MNRGIRILKLVVIGIVAVAVFGLVTQSLWNWLVPSLFGGPAITFWQALGLLALSKIITWGFGHHKGGWRHRGGPWNPAWTQKWQSMSPEDRERFKEKMKEKWCYTPKAPLETDSGLPKA